MGAYYSGMPAVMVMMKVVTVIKVVPPPPGQRQHRSPAGASRSQSVLSSPPRSEGWSRTVTHTRNTHTSLSCFIVKYGIVFGVCSCVVSLPVVVHHATYCCIGVILQDVSCAGVFTFLLSIHSSPQRLIYLMSVGCCVALFPVVSCCFRSGHAGVCALCWALAPSPCLNS